MDMRSYAPKYIKPDHVRDGRITSRIIAVLQNERFNRPMLELENGSQFKLNETNNTILMKAWGYNSEDWIGQEIAFEIGTYKGWNDDQIIEKETVKVVPISPRKPTAQQNGSTPPPSRALATKDDIDDAIPL